MFWWFHFVETVKKMLIYSFIHSPILGGPVFYFHSFIFHIRKTSFVRSFNEFIFNQGQSCFLMSRSRNSFTKSRFNFFTKSSIWSFFDSLLRLGMQIKPTRYYLGWDWFSNTQFVHQFVMKNYPSTDSIYPLAKVNQLKIVTDYLHAP